MKIREMLAATGRWCRANRALIGFAAGVVVAMVSLQAVFAGITSFGMRPKIAAYIYVGDAVMFALPLWVMRGRWRVLTLAGVWAASLFLWANTLYWRYWGEMIPFGLIFNASSYNNLVFDAVVPSLRWIDAVYMLIPAALTLWYVRERISRSAPLRLRWSVVAVVATAVIYCLCSLRVSVSIIRYMHSIGMESSIADTLDFRFSDPERVSTSYANIGLTAYTVRSLAMVPRSMAVDLDDEERARVERYISSAPAYAADPLFEANRGKNLILVIVESLNSPYFGRVYDGKYRVTPTLDSLAAMEGSIVARNVVTQVRDGSSSDGQMMYNTGLLPLKRGAASMNFADNSFESLAGQLGFAERFEVIIENPAVWNHNRTTRSWGYDRLISLYGDERFDKEGEDAVMFSRALDEITLAKQPFLAEIVTLSMHFPFEDEGATPPAWIGEADFDSDMERKYVAMTAYFDACLGRFLAGLRSRGLMENSVLVVVSDHTQGFASDFDDNDENRCVFIAANTGRSATIDRAVGQIDVFPTLLEIMGAYDTARWRGLGRSMLDPDIDAAIDRFGRLHGSAADGGQRLREASEVSELMIRSDWFRAVPARP